MSPEDDKSKPSCLAQLAACMPYYRFDSSSLESLRRSARVAWSTLFALALVIAWLFRANARSLLSRVPWIVNGGPNHQPSDGWYAQQAVFRVSAGNFVFFGVMSLMLLGIKYKGDKRSQRVHYAAFNVKLITWLLFTVTSLLLPNAVINAYGSLAQIGSGLFLVVLMIILLDGLQHWNDAWAHKGEADGRWRTALLATPAIVYVVVIVLVGVLYHWFKPARAGGCIFNMAVVTFTLVLVLLLAALSLHPAAREGAVMPTAFVSLYIVYLCFSALASEPEDNACHAAGLIANLSNGNFLALGMAATLASVVYAAFRAGSTAGHVSCEGSEQDGDEDDAERDFLLAEEGTASGTGQSRSSRPADAEYVPIGYHYSTFHTLFALGSMYIAMLMTGWGSLAQEEDHRGSWLGTSVKLVAELASAGLYGFLLMAPALMPEREFP